MPKAQPRVVLITASGMKEAKKISKVLVGERLAACVSTLNGVRSEYRWKGKTETASEVLLIAKTDRSRTARLIRRVKQIHSYEVPEVIVFPVTAGNPDYLAWIGKSLRP